MYLFIALVSYTMLLNTSIKTKTTIITAKAYQALLEEKAITGSIKYIIWYKKNSVKIDSVNRRIY